MLDVDVDVDVGCGCWMLMGRWCVMCMLLMSVMWVWEGDVGCGGWS